MRGKLFVLLISSVMVMTALFCALPQELSPSQQRQFGQTPPGTLGEVVDSDQDGVMDADEIDFGLNPQNPDSDGDGLRDSQEVSFWNNISASRSNRTAPDWVQDRHPGASQLTISRQWGPAGDLDGDGRPNANDSDADSDGVMDGRELQLGLGPADPDTDQDGIIDGVDPHPGLNSDADTDGMADDWETVLGVTDPVADTDMDGQTNLQEFLAGTDPRNDFMPGGNQLSMGTGELRLQGFGDFYGSGSLTQALFQITPRYNPRYWRLQTFDTYSGRKWTATVDMMPYNGTLPDYSDVVSPEMRNNGETYRIVVNGTISGYLPTAAHTTAVSHVEPLGQRLQVSSQAAFGTTGPVSAYNLTADLQNYKDGLSSARPDASRTGLLTTPFATGSRVRTLALNITAGKTTTTAKLEAIALWLSDNCRFDRSAAAPSANEDPVEHFLFDSKAGISPDFASAFTIVCRLNGIPARVAVGFAPGVLRGEERYVQLGHKHAWSEVALEGIGWVGVECTPDNAAAGHGIGLGSSGIDTNILQFWDNGVESWWYYEDRPEHVGGNGGGSASGGFFEVRNPNALPGDSDGDGLNDSEELRLKTNPYSNDTDSDRLNDSFEVSIGCNPCSTDSDGEGVCDYDEVMKYHSNPMKSDTDSGHTCDNQEAHAGTDLNNASDDARWRDFDNDHVADWDEDSRGTDWRGTDRDRDGLSDNEEIFRGTDPRLSDSDSDGLLDAYETELGTNPMAADSDGDGLNDWLETSQGLNPWSRDTDGDGIDDATEYFDHDLNPRVFDQDRDGLSDAQELQRHTDPRNIDTNNDGFRDGQEVVDAGGSAPARTDGSSVALLGIAIVVALAAVYAIWHRKHVGEIESALKRAERQIMELDIDAEPDDVRRVIYRTYKDLCGVLRKYGFLRGKSVTLREFEGAVGAAISIDAGRLSELTGIVEEARYSDHRLSADYKDRALSCIRGILGSMGAGGATGARRGAKAAA